MTFATDYEPMTGEWRAIDIDQYDGAPDAGPQAIGYGRTEKEAIADLKLQLEEVGK